MGCAAYLSNKVRTHFLVAAKGGLEQGLQLLGFECLPIGCYPEAPSKSPVMIDLSISISKLETNMHMRNAQALENNSINVRDET